MSTDYRIKIPERMYTETVSRDYKPTRREMFALHLMTSIFSNYDLIKKMAQNSTPLEKTIVTAVDDLLAELDKDNKNE